MSRAGPRVLTNLASMVLLRLASAGLGFLLVVYLARAPQGPQTLGSYSLLLSLFAFLQFLPLLGLHVAVTRDAARSPHEAAATLANAICLAQPVAWLLVPALGLGGSLLYASQPQLHTGLWLLALALIPTAFITAVEAALTGRERTDLVAMVGILESLARTVASLAALALGHGLDALLVVFLAGRVLAALFYLRTSELRPLLDRAHASAGGVGRLVRMMPVFLAIMVLASAVDRLDFLLLSRLVPIEQVGLYAAPYKLYELALMVPRILSAVLLPRFAACLQAHPQGFGELVQLTLRLGVSAGMPCAIGLAFLAPEAMRLFGHAYGAASSGVLALLALGALGVAVNNLLSVVLIVTGNQRRDLHTLLVTCIAYAGLLAWAIPRWGIVGAAAATLAISVGQPLVAALLLRQQVKLRPMARAVAAPAAGGIAMATVLGLLHEAPVVAGAVAGLCAYAVVLWLCRGVTADHLARFRHAIAHAQAARP